MMAKRDRSSGWKHAKLSGHNNETLVNQLLDSNKEYQKNFMSRLGFPAETIKSTSVGGLHETNVPGVLGKKTKSKTDLKIKCISGRKINISIKKSLSGQVYFVDACIFIKVFEKQFHQPIPKDVKRAIKLFWAAADDALSIIKEYGNTADIKSYKLQIRHKSLNATTLKNYDIELYNSMLQWFKDNIYNITMLSFAMGAAEDKNEWSDYIWYINRLGENTVDKIFHIKTICEAAKKAAVSETCYGVSNGGTTIQLPFGFVQWHQGKMQFHHSYKKLCDLTLR